MSNDLQRAIRKYKRNHGRYARTSEELSRLEFQMGIVNWTNHNTYVEPTRIREEWSTDPESKPYHRIARIPDGYNTCSSVHVYTEDVSMCKCGQIEQRRLLIKKLKILRKRTARAAFAVMAIEDRLGIPERERFSHRYYWTIVTKR